MLDRSVMDERDDPSLLEEEASYLATGRVADERALTLVLCQGGMSYSEARLWVGYADAGVTHPAAVRDRAPASACRSPWTGYDT